MVCWAKYSHLHVPRVHLLHYVLIELNSQPKYNGQVCVGPVCWHKFFWHHQKFWLLVAESESRCLRWPVPFLSRDFFFFQVRRWPSPGFHPLLTVNRDSGEQLFSFSSLCRWCNLRNDLQPMMTHLFSPLLRNIDGGPQRVIFHASLGLEGPLEVSNVNALVSRLPVVVCRFSSTWVLQEKLYQNGKKLW